MCDCIEKVVAALKAELHHMEGMRGDWAPKQLNCGMLSSLVSRLTTPPAEAARGEPASPPGQPATQPEFDAERPYRANNVWIHGPGLGSGIYGGGNVEAATWAANLNTAYAAGLAAREQPYRVFNGEKLPDRWVHRWNAEFCRWGAIASMDLQPGDTYIPQPPAPKEVR